METSTKISIGALILLLMPMTANAQGFGHCDFGNYPFGNCILESPLETPSGGGGGGGGGNIITDYLNLFTQFTSDIFKRWFLDKNIPVLEYRIEAPTQIISGEKINIDNLFTNEVDNSSIEVHCINFFDTNKNGIIDSEEPQESFNKKAEPRILNNITTTLIIPKNQKEGNYLLAGQCELGLNSPNATASRSIHVIAKEPVLTVETSKIDNFFNILKKNQVIILSIIFLLVLLFFASNLLLQLITQIWTIFIQGITFLFELGFLGLIIIALTIILGWWYLTFH